MSFAVAAAKFTPHVNPSKASSQAPPTLYGIPLASSHSPTQPETQRFVPISVTEYAKPWTLWYSPAEGKLPNPSRGNSGHSRLLSSPDQHPILEVHDPEDFDAMTDVKGLGLSRDRIYTFFPAGVWPESDQSQPFRIVMEVRLMSEYVEDSFLMNFLSQVPQISDTLDKTWRAVLSCVVIGEFGDLVRGVSLCAVGGRPVRHIVVWLNAKRFDLFVILLYFFMPKCPSIVLQINLP